MTQTPFETPSTSLAGSLTASQNKTFSHSNEVASSTLSSSNALSGTASISQSESAPVIWNPEWANWDVTTGVYRDSTNQTGRYLESVLGVITDQMTDLQWQKLTAPNTYNWTAAKAYCDNLFQGGYEDWRLPTRVELQSLVDYTTNCTGPTINNVFFPDTQTTDYWTSEFLAGSQRAWSISFGSGSGYGGVACVSGGYGVCGAPYSNYIRCVRPLSLSRTNDRYRDENGNLLSSSSQQVSDLISGLIWERGSSGLYAWSATAAPNSAQEHCNQLTIGAQGAGRWRLPSVKELATLLDTSLRQPGPTINSTVFPSTCAAYNGYWSSTPYTCSLSNAWLFGFDYGYYIAQYSITSGYCARCVRSPVVPNPE
jgi:hypothetical protein